jgi:hypothetical protein
VVWSEKIPDLKALGGHNDVKGVRFSAISCSNPLVPSPGSQPMKPRMEQEAAEVAEGSKRPQYRLKVSTSSVRRGRQDACDFI